MKDLDLIYVTARELSPEDRPAYLTKACEGDNGLRRRLEQMLAVADEAEAFITDLSDAESDEREPGGGTIKVLQHEIADIPDETVGQKIGRYKILERVGEGGCGVVYVASKLSRCDGALRSRSSSWAWIPSRWSRVSRPNGRRWQ